jgi:hypothetical protein
MIINSGDYIKILIIKSSTAVKDHILAHDFDVAQ